MNGGSKNALKEIGVKRRFSEILEKQCVTKIGSTQNIFKDLGSILGIWVVWDRAKMGVFTQTGLELAQYRYL